ncbi:MAG: SUMF1/EgtB/PvdO family nonheme iron enzyme [Melioribacteraceae bacterium]|nr:SUMF1/EgtB/PvdO family nonheme iron enzyme [Melioribacteraceae bacterium]
MFKSKKTDKKKTGIKKYLYGLVFLLGIIFTIGFNYGLEYSSSNEFCESCHVHPQATQSWKLGNHFDNRSGVLVKCVDCHLPPDGFDYLYAKTTTGLRDVYGKLFKDEDEFNWEAKSTREGAEHHIYKSGCIKCHQNLFPRALSKKGEDAHLYYDSNSETLRCINCHLTTGHFHEKSDDDLTKSLSDKNPELFTAAAKLKSFENFTETIPNTHVSWEMIAIPEGSFKIGTPKEESYRSEVEGPQKEVKISKFWMAKVEVTWNEFLQFLEETGVQGRTEDQKKSVAEKNGVDAISGPTPPYGNPGQGWGKGERPAITMTFYSAQKYCEWLSKRTGKTYRLPTEAEWEYASRSGVESAYFFKGDPDTYSEKSFWNSLFGTDTSIINSYAVYRLNSRGKTGLPSSVKENPFGLKNMLGNVKEFCADWYVPNYYSQLSDGVIDPKGPASGKERVVRGGSYKNDASDLRAGKRNYTKHDAWMVTDPQIPKSLWWYSDCNDVGFRVVCEFNDKLFQISK